jgi:hypothetical protein
MSLTATTTITPVANADGGAREFLQHLAATATGVVLPVLAGQHSLTHAQAEQLAVGLIGNGLTYWLPETPTGVQRWSKKALPVVTGVAAALVPLVASGGSLAALAGVAGVVPVLHVLAGLVNVARPNVTTTETVTVPDPVDEPAEVGVVPVQGPAPAAETTAPAAPSSPVSVPVTGATTAVVVSTPDIDPATVTSSIPVVPGGFTFSA